MPMGTPTEDEVSRPVDPYEGFKFDPMTGKPLHQDETASESDPDDFTHYVHLADGRVLKTKGVVTHYADSDDPNDRGVPVVAVYPRYVN